MKKTLFIFFILLMSLFSFANADEKNIEQANKEYSEEMYDNAIELYKKIINNGYESAELYYNLGNSYFKLNDMPSAILYYEKAKKLAPNDEDIDFNLKVANNKIVDKIETVPVLFFHKWWKSIYNLFKVDTLAKISIIGFFMFFILISLYLLSKVLIIRKLAFWTGIIFFIITIFAITLSYQKYNSFNNRNEAIVFTSTITVKSSPNKNSVDLFVIHEGTKVNIIEKLGEWCEIKIANGSVGWLPVSSLKSI